MASGKACLSTYTFVVVCVVFVNCVILMQDCAWLRFLNHVNKAVAHDKVELQKEFVF